MKEISAGTYQTIQYANASPHILVNLYSVPEMLDIDQNFWKSMNIDGFLAVFNLSFPDLFCFALSIFIFFCFVMYVCVCVRVFVVCVPRTYTYVQVCACVCDNHRTILGVLLRNTVTSRVFHGLKVTVRLD